MTASKVSITSETTLQDDLDGAAIGRKAPEARSEQPSVESPDVGPPQTRELIPLWLAVAITVMVALPFGLYLHKYALPLWVSFVVWAEYFALGANVKALRTIVPSYVTGVALTAVVMSVNAEISPLWGVKNLGLYLTLFVGLSVMVYIMRFSKTLTAGSLPYFNGISMLLGVYFTSSFPSPISSTVWVLPLVAGLWAIVAGLFGALLGWFNVTITFPRPVRKT